MDGVSNRAAFPLWISLVAAIGLLNIALTFANVWPTLAVTWRGDLSAELAVVLLAFVWLMVGDEVMSRLARLIP